MQNSMHRTIFGGLLAGSLAVGLAACGGDDILDADGNTCAEPRTIAFSHPVGEAEGAKLVKKFAQQRADEIGCIELLLDNTTANNLESQRQTVEGWVSQNVEAIVLLPVEESAFIALQKDAQAKGIKWLVYGSHMEGEDGSTGFDSVKSGELIAEDLGVWISENYPNGGVSAAVTKLSALPILAGRWEKPIEKLEELGIPIVSQQDCADQACGLQVAEDSLREHDDLRIFIGMTDDPALGAMKAFSDASIDPEKSYLAGYDGNSQSLAAIEDEGYYKASATIRLDDLGYSIIDNSIAAIEGDDDTDKIAATELATSRDMSALRELQELFE